MLNRYTLILLLQLIMTLVCAQYVVAQNAVSNAAVKGAVLCANEAGYNPFDCAAITAMRMRSAARAGRSFEEELYYLHGDGRVRARSHASLRSDRATNVQRHDSRPWLGDIAIDLHQPLHWPAQSDWQRHSRDFQRLFRLVQDILDGRRSDRCQGYPLRWGGPRVDTELVEHHIQNGETVIDCGATANIFLGQRR